MIAARLHADARHAHLAEQRIGLGRKFDLRSEPGMNIAGARRGYTATNRALQCGTVMVISRQPGQRPFGGAGICSTRKGDWPGGSGWGRGGRDDDHAIEVLGGMGDGPCIGGSDAALTAHQHRRTASQHLSLRALRLPVNASWHPWQSRWYKSKCTCGSSPTASASRTEIRY